MCELFADIPEALANSVEIAKRCNVTVRLGEYFLPQFPTGDMTTEDFLVMKSKEGLEERLAFLFPDPEERAKRRPEYDERLDIELQVINQMGFPGYFLIVMEFIQWSKDNGVPVGPGRGSGAGSLVAYALKITDLDPLEFDLLFERFLNPERVSMPDFDVDFCMEKRDPGYRARGGYVRPRRGIADHHLRYHGGESGHPRCRSRAGSPVRICRSYLQAGAARSGHDAGESL
ncbi:DNA polymerase III alpha subunit [Klebsiella pneumoniae]|nr:DNA polymerase III alpha subunit [Klebsiella pneumoniae]